MLTLYVFRAQLTEFKSKIMKKSVCNSIVLVKKVLCPKIPNYNECKIFNHLSCLEVVALLKCRR